MAQGRRKAPVAAENGKATRRVVLERVRVVVLPENPIELGGALTDHPVVEAWIERGEFDGNRAITAIEAYVKPGTPEQRTGEFRAPPLSNWKGGARFVQPALTPVTRELIV